ncbi:hypothetical protein C1H46_012475 [Malus baccata]|uniref:MalT-like TPR region domain-containing protein n=1 Tax=Malus baccata TaxID=106549 RepID=A0A540MSW8_MALBA|nr:hypothetical protein C1H46_012475 [Malus baccata]
MRNLKIGSGNEFLNTKVGGFTFNARRLNSAPGLDKGGFVFGNGNKKNSSIVSKLPKDMRKLNIEGAEKREAVEAGKEQKFNFNANDKTKFGSGSIDNVGGSLGQNVESELPNELKKRLNIKETVQLDRSTDWPSADDVNKFVFGNSKNDSYSLAGTSENVLPDKMNNLNIKDTFDGRKDLAMATERLDINEVDATNREAKEGSFEYHHNGSVDAEGTLEGSMSQVETESFKSTAEELDFNGDNSHTSAETEASSGSYLESHDTDGRIHIAFPSWSDNRSGSNFSFAASSAAQSQVSASKRLQKKKILVKAGQDTNTVVPNVKIPYASSSSQFLPYSGTSAHLSPGHYQKIESSNPQRRHGDNSGVRKEQELKQEITSFSAEAAAAQEAFEKLRLRGNQAYSNGDLSKAEDCYTHCYLALGEVEGASQHFRSWEFLELGSRSKNLWDRSEGLDFTFMLVPMEDGHGGLANVFVKKLSELLSLSAELLLWKTSTNAERALELIAEGLVISPSSEKLLEMKAEALFALRRYEEVIELCEHTFSSAEKNNLSIETNDQAACSDGSEFSKYFYFRLWRCHMIVKSYFYLGKLEEGLASLEKHEEKVSTKYRNWRETVQSSEPLFSLYVNFCLISYAQSVLGFLTKMFPPIVQSSLGAHAAGNEAFQGGRHTEAVEHYTTALSCNVESHLFTAVCFCNCAAAYKALGQITDAIADCSLPIALDGNYLKAISRRATLCEMIRDYGQAAKDLQRLVSILTKQVEEKTNLCGTSDRSISSTSDMRQARLRLSEIEEDRRDIPLDMYLILLVLKLILQRSRYDTEEEMRNAQKKRGGSSTSGMPADVQSLPI